MAVFVLAALIGGTLYAARLYLFPFRNCRHCVGTGRKPSRLNRRSYGLCHHCAGNGRVLRHGARLVHRAVLTARSPQVRARLHQQDRKAIERSTPPRRPAPARELPWRDVS